MPLFPLLHLSIMAAMASALFSSLWQGSLLVLIVSLGLRILPGLTAAARAAVWVAVLLLIAVHPLLALFRHGMAPGGSAGVIHAEFGFSVALVAVWAMASLFRLFQLLIGGAELWRTLRSARPLGAPAGVAALLRESVRRPVLCASESVNRPCVAGFFRPRLLLPADLLPGLKESELTQIVLHELEHLRRGDDWVNLLQQVVLVVLPLHPAMFWVNRQMALERELACDDAVLETTRAGKAYAACLAHVAEQSLMRQGLSLAVGALGRRRPELTARVERILRRPERTFSGLRLRLATGMVLAGTVFAGGMLERSPVLVSFGPGMADGSVPRVQVASAALETTFPGNGAAREDGTPRSGDGAPRAVLLKAVMPADAVAEARRSNGRLRPAIRHMRRAAVVRAGLQRRGRAGAPWLMLTSWQEISSDRDASEVDGMARRLVPAVSAPRLVPVGIATQQVWYSAVRYEDGWLVVQL